MKRTLATLCLVVVVVSMSVVSVGASGAFPYDGASLEFWSVISVHSTNGNMTSSLSESMTFHKTGAQWNVTLLMDGEVTCTPSTANVTVKYRTKAGYLPPTSNPVIAIRTSFVMKDRAITSSPPGAVVGYFALCSFLNGHQDFISQSSPAESAAPTGYYAEFYIHNATQPGASVYAGSHTVGPLSVKELTVLGSSRAVLYGKSPRNYYYYWDRLTGILVLEEYTSDVTTETYTLRDSSLPIPEFNQGPLVALLVVAGTALFATKRKLIRSQTVQ